jgi:hypothetical protein
VRSSVPLASDARSIEGQWPTAGPATSSGEVINVDSDAGVAVNDDGDDDDGEGEDEDEPGKGEGESIITPRRCVFPSHPSIGSGSEAYRTVTSMVLLVLSINPYSVHASGCAEVAGRVRWADGGEREVIRRLRDARCSFG